MPSPSLSRSGSRSVSRFGPVTDDNADMAKVGRLRGVSFVVVLGAAACAHPAPSEDPGARRPKLVADLEDDLRTWAWHEQIAPACSDEPPGEHRPCGLLVDAGKRDDATIRWRYRMADPTDVDRACRRGCDARARELAWLTSHNRHVLADAFAQQASRRGVEEQPSSTTAGALPQLPYGLIR